MTTDKKIAAARPAVEYDSENIAIAVLTLAHEFWALRDRVQTLEDVLSEKGVPVAEAIETRTLTDKQQAERDAAVKAFAGRLISAMAGIPPKNPSL